MKVLSINPGTVFPDKGGFSYSYSLNGKLILCENIFSTASAAKQAMREKVSHERKRHGLEKNK